MGDRIPRRISKAYLWGFSNKPFKDDKPPARQSSLGKMLSTPGGVVEWAASDGRKGTLTGLGKARAEDVRSRKPSFNKSAKVEGAPDKQDERKESKLNEKESIKGKEKATGDDDDDNADRWSAEEDKKLLAWKAENGTKAWAVCAEEVGRPTHECKERWKHIQPKTGDQDGRRSHGGNQNVGQAQGGYQHARQAPGTSGDGQPQQLTKKEKKALKQRQSGGQSGENNQGQGQNQNQNNKPETSGTNDTGDIFGMGFGMADGNDAEEKKNGTDNKSYSGGHDTNWGDQAKVDNNDGRGGASSNKDDNLWGKPSNDASGGGNNGWDSSGVINSGGNGDGWGGLGDDSGNNDSGGNNAWNNSNNEAAGGGGWGNKIGGSKNGGGSNGNGGDGWNDTHWGNDNSAGSKNGALSSKGGGNTGGNGWGGNNNGSGSKTGAPSNKGGPDSQNNNNNNGWGDNAADVSGGNWNSSPSGGDTNNGGWANNSGNTRNDATNPGWGNQNQKPPSNSNAAAGWADGANDATPDQWNSGPSDAQNNGPSNTQTNAPSHPQNNDVNNAARPPSHRAPSAVSPPTPACLELYPDDTFSANDLRLIARILQQDYGLMWDRLSWRFRDKTGRWVAADVFERKLTGKVEKEEESAGRGM